ncbi:MAG: glycoside hydrolase domain-containing protein [Pseudomonadota bacterium]
MARSDHEAAQRAAGAAALGRRRVLTLGAGLGGAALAGLTGCATAPAIEPSAPAQPQPAPAPAPAPVRQLTPRAAPAPMIIDTATKLGPAEAEALAASGVETVFRYYSYVPSNIRGKDLQPDETRALQAAGLSIGVVFQHYNNCFDAFANGWGGRDAAQALRLAETNSQPAGSAIYFGVDGDWPYESLLGPALAYFEAVAERFEGSGLAIGAYGGGCILEELRKRGLASYFWLSGSTGFTGTQAFYNSGRWTLFQNHLDITRPSPRVGIDTNLLNPAANGYFGQFSAAGARAATHDPAAGAAVFGARRFVRRASDLLSAPDAGAPPQARLRALANVKLLAAGDGWAEVETQEGGSSRRAPARRGFLWSEDLAPMDQMPGGVRSYGLCGAARAAPDSVRNANCTAPARAFRA